MTQLIVSGLNLCCFINSINRNFRNGLKMGKESAHMFLKVKNISLIECFIPNQLQRQGLEPYKHLRFSVFSCSVTAVLKSTNFFMYTEDGGYFLNVEDLSILKNSKKESFNRILGRILED